MHLSNLCHIQVQLVSYAWRLFVAKVSEQLVVDEPKQCYVELQEGGHDLVVNIERQSLVELVRGYPGDVLAHDFCLIINTLDREEGLLEALSSSAVEHEFFVEFATGFDILLGDLQSLMLR